MGFLSNIFNSGNSQQNSSNTPNSIQGFFMTNLGDVSGLNIRFIKKDKWPNGGIAFIYQAILPYYDLRLFNVLEITQKFGNTCNLKFSSSNSAVALSPELEALINFCVSIFGKDYLGKGKISSSEKVNLFYANRHWIDKIEFDFTNGACVKIYNYQVANLPMPDLGVQPHLGYTIDFLMQTYGIPSDKIQLDYSSDQLSSYIIAFDQAKKLFVLGEEFDWKNIVGMDYSNNPHTESSPISIETKRKSSSVIGRAAVGTLIAGPIGAVVGAATAKQNTTITQETSTKYNYIVYINTNLPERPKIEINLGEFDAQYSNAGDYIVDEIRNLVQRIIEDNSLQLNLRNAVTPPPLQQ